MPSVGDRVLGQWEPEWFYPGVIVTEGGGTFVVQFDDGDRAQLQPNQVREMNIGTGSRVYCRWRGGPQYYPGSITAINGNAIDVSYDDGDQESTTVSMCRVNAADFP